MGVSKGTTGTAQQVVDDFHQTMLVDLRDMNAVVGKTSLEEIYNLTPKELDYTLAGGYQRSYDYLQDLRFALGTTVVPTAFVDPAKYDSSQADNSLKKRKDAIASITDEKVKEKIEKKQKQQQRFIDFFM